VCVVVSRKAGSWSPPCLADGLLNGKLATVVQEIMETMPSFFITSDRYKFRKDSFAKLLV